MSIFRRMKIWCRVVYTFIFSFFGTKKKILSPQETVEMIKNGRSLIRFGDGEFGIFHGKDIHYQNWSIELKEAFDSIKKDFERQSKDCPYLLAVPQQFMKVNGFRLMKKRVYVSCWSEARYDFQRRYSKTAIYGDSFLFEKKNKELYSEIWNGENCPNNVIFVHNSKDCANAFADTYHKNTKHVVCPPRDAFESVEGLEKEILSIIAENGWTAKDVMMTISAGPAGKVLVYRLSKQGYHCIDAGHCWDDPLEGM